MGSACLLTNEVRLKQYLGAAEALTAKGDDDAVWTLTGLLHDVAVEIFADVYVGLHDGLDVVSLIPLASFANEVGLKQYLGAAEALTAKGDDVFTGLLHDVAVEISAGVYVGLHDGLDVVSLIPLASLPMKLG